MKIYTMRYVSVVMLVCLLGCGDTSTGVSTETTPPPSVVTRSVKADPSYEKDIWEIFVRNGCSASSCHGGGAGGLSLSTSAGSYAMLVGVASSGTGEVFVIPSNAAGSYLVKKLDGSQSVGSRMPLGGAVLDDTDMKNIKNWINQGAKKN
ncbi:MAG TPA: hypothetical protein EYQ69_06790 [Gemmatimonadetes bacterium]|nr:hypothetical protein [Gemmatimonadota bacterium]